MRGRFHLTSSNRETGETRLKVHVVDHDPIDFIPQPGPIGTGRASP